MRNLFLFLVTFLLIGCNRSVLPSDQKIMGLGEAEVRDLVLRDAPLGTTRQAVEQVFSRSFRRKYKVVDYEFPELISQHGFSVRVGSGDYYLMSDLASKMTGLGTTRTVTVYLLFDSAGHLKDIAVKTWSDSI